MKSVAVKAQNIVLLAAEPTFPGERVSEQKKRAFNRLRLYQVPAGDSKLHNAWNRRAGGPTLNILKNQAEIVGLLKDNSAEIAWLISTAEMLRAQDANYHEAHIRSIEWAVRQLSPRTHLR